MTIRFVFKSGYMFDMKCEKFSLTRNFVGDVTGWDGDGITENKPIHFDLNDILCIYRLMVDEVSEAD